MAETSTLNITQNLTHTLGLAILRGDFVDALPSEAEICERFGVSRSSTREAVKMLSAKGLIRSRPKQGIRIQPERNWNMFDPDVLKWTLVSKPTLNLLREFFEMRLVTDPQAAALAAQHALPENIVELRKSIDRMRDAESGLDDSLDADIAFVTALFEATHNRFFIQLIEFTSTALRVTSRYSNRMQGVSFSNLATCIAVFDAIVQKQADTAFELVQNMLTQMMETVLADT
ncbi:FCD domain-containing protein [Alteromonas sp. ASW11-36]|uniref:FCD domain-containing protein n=1 Tax=Alteromonas arenosi TaxID=3055817 RepID=A0ABT7STA4_9ALTE|nr:FCD domain-containing protein [Alteromonas sp. ASW11-36]MDM7859219.1 FCD domain-containing protein [Alteromonas sp. ASW11-36]